jgi:hypothetical protein
MLAALASPLFLAAAVAAWAYGVWPATPVTFGIAALVVMSGPLLGIYQVSADKREDDDDDYIDVVDYVEEPTIVLGLADRADVPLTQKAAEAKAFNNWRNSDNPSIAHRDRERRANAYLRT